MAESAGDGWSDRVWGWDRPARAGLAVIAAAVGFALALGSGRESSPASVHWSGLRADANDAPAAVLGSLPGLGPTLSARIVAGRADGPYESFADLDRRVKGIGPAKTRGLSPYLRFGSEPGSR